MSRPDMRFVPVKSADQQAVLMLHKTRALMVKQRTILAAEIQALDASIDELEAEIAKASAGNLMSRNLDEIPAFGPLIASAMVAFQS